jgi:tetratricopeptide (TPR) repeat protein
MSFAAAAYSFRERLNGRRAKAIAASAFTLTVIVLSVAAYERNRVWGTEITLWEDTVRKSPGKARGHTNLGRAYADGPEEPCETEKAMEHLLIAIRLDPDNVDAHFNLGLLYLERGSAEEARREFTETLRIDPAHRAKLFLDYLDHR